MFLGTEMYIIKPFPPREVLLKRLCFKGKTFSLASVKQQFKFVGNFSFVVKNFAVLCNFLIMFEEIKV